MPESDTPADTVFHVEDADGNVLPGARYSDEHQARKRWHAEEAEGVTVEEYDRNEHRLYSVREENITGVDGIEIDIELRQQIGGAGERDIDRVWAELKDHIGLVAQALEDEKPPSEIEERDPDKIPMMTVDWERVFDGGEE